MTIEFVLISVVIVKHRYTGHPVERMNGYNELLKYRELSVVTEPKDSWYQRVYVVHETRASR